MRDDFDGRVKNLLASRVGFRCSNPDCKRSTSGPQTNPLKSINLGVASHIKAASMGGKRYDSNQTTEQRKSADNGIWLCQLCSKLIDSDEEKYTVEYLYDWKTKAELRASKELERRYLDEEAHTLIIKYTKDDKDFALWVSLQLISQGYPVWCDLLDIEPGENTQLKVRELIKDKAAKYLFILSDSSNYDSNLLKELRFAYEVMSSKKAEGFVVPVRIMDIPQDELNILLQDTSPIDFSQSWSMGLNDLLKYLEKSGVIKDEQFTPSKANDLWRLQFDADKGIKYESEELLSNWFPIRLPEILYFHELQRKNIGLMAIQKEKFPFPAIQHNIHLITFAKASDFSEKLGDDISIKSTTEIKIQEFFNRNYNNGPIKEDLVWKFVTELLNTAWELFLSKSKLRKYNLSNNRSIYYFTNKFSDKGDEKAYFQIDGKRKWRSLAGKHKSNFWNYGIHGRAVLYPEPAFVVKAHGLASNDGIHVWGSKEKLHTARRRWFKNWWNSEWRDRLLAAMSYLSSEKESFEIPLGSDVFISVSSSPLIFLSPVTYSNSRDVLLEAEIEEGNLLDDEEFDAEVDDMSEDDDL